MMQKYRLSKNLHGQANGGNGTNKTGNETNNTGRTRTCHSWFLNANINIILCILWRRVTEVELGMGWRVGSVAVSGDQRLAEPNGATRTTNNIVVAPHSNKYTTFLPFFLLHLAQHEYFCYILSWVFVFIWYIIINFPQFY